MAIDVGAVCLDRGSFGGEATRVEGSNAANASGVINQVQVWFDTGGAIALEFASFAAAGNNLTTNGDTDGSGISVDTDSCDTVVGGG